MFITIKKKDDFRKIFDFRIYALGEFLTINFGVLCMPALANGNFFLNENKKKGNKKISFFVGFVVSKKVGNAVIRNLVKRRLKAILIDAEIVKMFSDLNNFCEKKIHSGIKFFENLEFPSKRTIHDFQKKSAELLQKKHAKIFFNQNNNENHLLKNCEEDKKKIYFSIIINAKKNARLAKYSSLFEEVKILIAKDIQRFLKTFN